MPGQALPPYLREMSAKQQRRSMTHSEATHLFSVQQLGAQLPCLRTQRLDGSLSRAACAVEGGLEGLVWRGMSSGCEHRARVAQEAQATAGLTLLCDCTLSSSDLSWPTVCSGNR